MNLVVTLNHHFNRTSDGAVWTHMQFAHSFWVRYLAVFDRVRVVARVRQMPSIPPDWQRADGEGVEFAAVPPYLGPWQYLLRAHQIQRAVRDVVGASDAVILRVVSQTSACLEPLLHRTGRPYGVEVVSDPYDGFAPGVIRHPLRPFFRWWFTRQLRRQCAGACAAAYVTEHALQSRYPPAPSAFSTHYSSVELPDAAFVPAPRLHRRGMRTFTLIFVGTLALLHKAPDVLIDAVAVCVRQGLDLNLILIGDGKQRAELETRAASLGLGQRVCFRGQLPGSVAVRDQLDEADLFVLPSRQEALPRAMIEAMARGLPCIGSTAGGFPELLPPEDMVSPGNAAALAHKICEVVTNPERMAHMSARNLKRAQAYKDALLHERRITFYRYVREKTKVWLQTQ